MIIRKFLHSCILLEENGKKLLFDPGAFSFVENKLKPEDIGPVDIIVYTHKHPDHYFPDALKSLLSLNSAKIIAHEEICSLIKQEGFACEKISTNETKNIDGFSIKAFEAPHGPLPIEVPKNLAFLINETFLHPGDSFSVSGLEKCEVLAMPIAGPWAKINEAIEFARSLKAKTVIPIHDAIIKDFFLEKMYSILCGPSIEKNGASFRPLKLGEILQV